MDTAVDLAETVVTEYVVSGWRIAWRALRLCGCRACRAEEQRYRDWACDVDDPDPKPRVKVYDDDDGA